MNFGSRRCVLDLKSVQHNLWTCHFQLIVPRCVSAEYRAAYQQLKQQLSAEPVNEPRFIAVELTIAADKAPEPGFLSFDMVLPLRLLQRRDVLKLVCQITIKGLYGMIRSSRTICR